MGEKLVRNTTNGESREWWDAVRSAAASAPKLTYDLKSRPKSKQSASTSKPSQVPRKKR
jgi:hypothetical protein